MKKKLGYACDTHTSKAWDTVGYNHYKFWDTLYLQDCPQPPAMANNGDADWAGAQRAGAGPSTAAGAFPLPLCSICVQPRGHRGVVPPHGDVWRAGPSEQAHVSTRKASSVVPWAPLDSAVTSDWNSFGPTENTVSKGHHVSFPRQLHGHCRYAPPPPPRWGGTVTWSKKRREHQAPKISF